MQALKVVLDKKLGKQEDGRLLGIDLKIWNESAELLEGDMTPEALTATGYTPPRYTMTEGSDEIIIYAGTTVQGSKYAAAPSAYRVGVKKVPRPGVPVPAQVPGNWPVFSFKGDVNVVVSYYYYLPGRDKPVIYESGPGQGSSLRNPPPPAIDSPPFTKALSSMDGTELQFSSNPSYPVEAEIRMASDANYPSDSLSFNQSVKMYVYASPWNSKLYPARGTGQSLKVSIPTLGTLDYRVRKRYMLNNNVRGPWSAEINYNPGKDMASQSSVSAGIQPPAGYTFIGDFSASGKPETDGGEPLVLNVSGLRGLMSGRGQNFRNVTLSGVFQNYSLFKKMKTGQEIQIE